VFDGSIAPDVRGLTMVWEIRWHGRGGQGLVTASSLLAEAALEEGKYIQAFPEFGPERMGAPIKAFNRISSRRIDVHSQVYEPNLVVVVDPTLLGLRDVVEGLREDGVLLANFGGGIEEVREKTGFSGSIYVVNATRIARETIGVPIANTACLGALARVVDVVKLDSLEKKFRERFLDRFGEKGVEKNVEAMRRAYREVKGGARG